MPARYQAFLYARDAARVTIAGGGTIDGQGDWWWANRANRSLVVAGRPNLVQLVNVTGVEVANVTLRDSPFWCLHPVCVARGGTAHARRARHQRRARRARRCQRRARRDCGGTARLASMEDGASLASRARLDNSRSLPLLTYVRVLGCHTPRRSESECGSAAADHFPSGSRFE